MLAFGIPLYIQLLDADPETLLPQMRAMNVSCASEREVDFSGPKRYSN